ncbi:lysosomal Pro-X carboxypeptidase [Achlya hypogyna]|uniref:Lysosomal Pro-X carboxypeptidase n=1 Tax=Achlya hypogyna TaxID=1202772 RepID=A0A1V9ZTP4_ACHHY|nr:lysosomal Pro-X carboxypeptidase [Achlya hypogyna]
MNTRPESQPLLEPRSSLRQPRLINWSIFVPVCLGISLICVGQLVLSVVHDSIGVQEAFTEPPNFLSPKPNATNCSLHWFEQRVDHFTTLNTTYNQRYYVYDAFWKRKATGATKDGPILFYCGNEGDVTLYVNNTGLMWENAEALGAVLIFAEHRYFGQSRPFGDDYKAHLAYLTHEQALADYAVLLRSFQTAHNTSSPVIALGGSYGGMLAAWFRIKYPGAISGAIAASAPILGFPEGYPDHFYGEKYWQIVTRDATPVAGAAPSCEANVRATWPLLFAAAQTAAGRAELSEIFRVCRPLATAGDADALAMGLLMAWDTMAMGNFPFPSSYLTDGAVDLPAYPVRAACAHMAANTSGLLNAMRDAANVYLNATQMVPCWAVDAQDFDGLWGYVWCSQMLPQESYFDTDGVRDMFWPRALSMAQVQADCKAKWGVTPDPQWIRTSYGSLPTLLKATSNIVFSNGGYDPWAAGGVDTNGGNPSIAIVHIAEGAHHLDLFFSHPDDPISVRHARHVELQHIRQWVRDF